MSPRPPVARDEIGAFCRRHGIRKFSLLGSVLGDDCGPDSKVDALAELRPGLRVGPFELVEMQEKLITIVDRRAENFKFQALGQWMEDEVAGSTEWFYESRDLPRLVDQLNTILGEQ